MEERAVERSDTSDRSVEVITDRPTVVTALPLRADARERLSRLLGARVVDIRDEGDTAELVLTPSSSPQLVGRLAHRYPGARIVVVELDDWELGIEMGGPVRRLLDAGAEAYVVADSIDELAERLLAGRTRIADAPDRPAAAIRSGTSVDDLISALLHESDTRRATVEADRRDEAR